jgi:Fe-S-cluster containining protein
MISSLSRRDELWNACAAKTCCRTTRVRVSAVDLARLVDAFELPPSAIVTAVPLRPPDDRHGFRLRPAGPRQELVLRKNGSIGPGGAPCVFLVEVTGGHALCGAGDVRPTACRAFPAVAVGDEVEVVRGGCSCRVWSAADIGSAERTSAVAAAAEEAADERMIAEWNRSVERDGRQRSLDELCDHLLNSVREPQHDQPSMTNPA